MAGTGRRGASAAVVLLGGAAVFALLRGVVGVTFNATPLLIGLVALTATAVRGDRQWGVGLVLVSWGTAVLLVRNGPLPNGREAAAFLVGAGVGLFLTAVVTPAKAAGPALRGAAITTTVGGLAFYAAYEVALLAGWVVYALALAVWGLWELRP